LQQRSLFDHKPRERNGTKKAGKSLRANNLAQCVLAFADVFVDRVLLLVQLLVQLLDIANDFSLRLAPLLDVAVRALDVVALRAQLALGLLHHGLSREVATNRRALIFTTISADKMRHDFRCDDAAKGVTRGVGSKVAQKTARNHDFKSKQAAIAIQNPAA